MNKAKELIKEKGKLSNYATSAALDIPMGHEGLSLLRLYYKCGDKSDELEYALILNLIEINDTHTVAEIIDKTKIISSFYNINLEFLMACLRIRLEDTLK